MHMSISIGRLIRATALMLGMAAGVAVAQDARPQASPKMQRDTATKLEVYGFVMADAIFDFNQNNPDWFDVNRPSRLPATKNQFGDDHRTWLSARQSRLGVKASIPTNRSDIKAVFEFDLFGVGVDAGQTT